MNRKNEWYVFLSGMFSALVIFLVYLFGATDAFAGESNVEERPAIIQQSASPTVPQVVDMRRQSTQSVQQQVPAQPPWLKEKGTLLPFEQHGYSKEQLDVQEGGCHWLKCRREKFCDSVCGVFDESVGFVARGIYLKGHEILCEEEWLDKQRADFGCVDACRPATLICGGGIVVDKVLATGVGLVETSVVQGQKIGVHTFNLGTSPITCTRANPVPVYHIASANTTGIVAE